MKRRVWEESLVVLRSGNRHVEALRGATPPPTTSAWNAKNTIIILSFIERGPKGATPVIHPIIGVWL